MHWVLTIEVVIWAIAIGFIIYYAIRRYHISKTEDFEDRDN